MAKLLHATARLTLGATLAGLITGYAEAVYWHAPKWYAALGYATLFGMLSVVVAPVLVVILCVRPRNKARMTTTPIGRGAFVVTLSFCALVLVRFILWRDVYAEAPQKQALALGYGAIAGGAVALVTTAALAIVSYLSGLRDAYNSDDASVVPRFAARLVWLPCAALWVSFGLLALWGMQPDAAPEAQGPLVTLAGPEGLAAAPPKATDQARPGVILVIADALRADALSSFGAGQSGNGDADPTPNLTRFARGARQFDNAVAAASWTKPSVASMMTSLPPSAHETMAKAAVLPDNLVTLAEVLQQHDVSTSAVVTNLNLSRAFGFQRGFDAFDYLSPSRYLGAPPEATRLAGYNMYRLVRERYFAQGRKPETFYQSAARVNAQAFDLLDRIGDAPYFMWLHYMEPHDPYFARDGRSFARVANPHPTAADAEAMHDAYRDGVRRLDAGFGALWDHLQARGLDSRTLVVVVADHGEEFGEHGGYYHGTSLYEQLVHVPLMMRGPRVPSGRTTVLAQHIDLAPTIARYLGAPKSADWQGRDLLDPAQSAPQVARLEEDHEGNTLTALRGGAPGQLFKHIVANAGNPRGLPRSVVFDLSQDASEEKPMPKASADDVIQSLAAFAHLQDDRMQERTVVPKAKKRTRPMSIDDEAQLRALGYVE